MERVEGEPFGLFCPISADELGRCEAFQRLQSAAKLVGGNEVGKRRAELLVVAGVEALDGCFLDGALPSFDLTFGPGLPWLAQPMLDVEVGAGEFEGVSAEEHSFCPHLLDVVWGPSLAGRIGEVGAVVGENRRDGAGLSAAAQRDTRRAAEAYVGGR